VGRSRKLKDKLKGSPCVFCFGGRPGDTVEHIPPRKFFLHGIRPKGLEFSACSTCNNGTGNLDQVASMFAMIGAEAINPGVFSADLRKLMQGVANNSPDVLDHIFTDCPDIERLHAPSGQTVIGIEVNRLIYTKWLNPWAAKQGVALWYNHTGTMFDPSLRMVTQWLSSEQVMFDGIPEEFLSFAHNSVSLSQGGRFFGDQFSYRFAVNIPEKLGFFSMLLHSSCICVAYVFPSRFLDAFSRDFRFGEIFKVTPLRGIERTLD